MRQQLMDALFGDGGLVRVRALLAFSFSAATIYLWVSGDPVPDALLATTTGAVGYYFGSRTASST